MKIVKNKLLVIVPAFNEGNSIINTVNKLKKEGYNYLVVNDCSYDATDLVCKEKNINFISNKKNFGLSKTMREGFKYAIEHGYEYCVQFDGDGQHDINTIKLMIEKISDYDIILGNRFKDSKEHSDKKKVVAWRFLRKLIKWNCGQFIEDPTCGLRMYGEKFIKLYVNNKKFEVEPSTIAYCISKFKMKVTDVPTIVHDRTEGESQFKSHWKIIRYMLKQARRLILTTKLWRYHKSK